MKIEEMEAGREKEEEKGGERHLSPEKLNHDVEEILLSYCERVGEGGKAIVLKLDAGRVPEELQPALESLSAGGDENRTAIKLFKVYLPNKGAFEYKMHQEVYRAWEEVPESEKDEYAKVPALSSSQEVTFDEDMRQALEDRYSVMLPPEKSQLIVMEYIDGDDLATVFYKWILEREGIPPEQIDTMDFKQLYEEVGDRLRFEQLPEEDIKDPRMLELAEWKNNSTNTDKIYDYLRKYKFPMPKSVASRVKKTIDLMHFKHYTHGDAFEKNIMITGGMRALREKGNLEGQDAYLIDYGETRDRFVEGVDDYNVIRRLERLGISKEDEERQKRGTMFDEITAKTEAIMVPGSQWRKLFDDVEKQAGIDVHGALVRAWSGTVLRGEGYIENFFILAKEMVDKGLADKAAVEALVAEEGKRHGSAYQKRRIQEGMEWFERMQG